MTNYTIRPRLVGQVFYEVSKLFILLFKHRDLERDSDSAPGVSGFEIALYSLLWPFRGFEVFGACRLPFDRRLMEQSTLNCK